MHVPARWAVHVQSGYEGRRWLGYWRLGGCIRTHAQDEMRAESTPWRPETFGGSLYMHVKQQRLPVCLMARPTVFDVLRERIEQDARIRPEIRQAVFLKSCQLIRERGITQL